MITAIGLLATALGLSLVSAVIPLLSIELFAVGLVVSDQPVAWWALALVIAMSQIAGKLLHYYAGRGAIQLPSLLRRSTEMSGRRRRYQEKLARFRQVCQQRRWWARGVLLTSATASLPPFAAVSAAAGLAKVPLVSFLVIGFVGRLFRFGSLTFAPEFATHVF